MADIYLTNSLTRKKEKFEPINPPNVSMYTCGPTVYDFVHIGNLRAYVFYDTLKRTLMASGFKVKHVMNITDVDDKIIKKANEEGVSIDKVTQKYEQTFFEDLKKLNIISPDYFPRATEYIEAMIELIQKLLDKGFAYQTDDGVYFSVKKFPNYGSLSQLDRREIKTGARVSSDEYTKEDAQDFALWKAKKEGEPSWDAPFGAGRPGWHIECSAMSTKLLGETLDIHAGGVDLIFPHHEDEIAQSEAASGKTFANFWLHNEHLLVDGKKMSKSLHNFFTLRDVEEKGFDPLALRYLYLTAHYRDPLNFTWESLTGAQSALGNLRSQITNLKSTQRTVLSQEKNEKVEKYRTDFTKAINDDINTPQALAVMWEMLKSSIPSPDKYDLALSFDEVLGLNLDKVSQVTRVPQAIKKLVEEREKLRKEGKWQKADEARKEIESKGYRLEDTPEGPQVKPS